MDFKFINTEYLYSVSGGDSEIIREIVTMFSEQVVEIYDQMKTLFGDKNYQELGMLAHKAKSSVAIMGMNELATLLKTFELETREGKNNEKYGSYIERFAHDTQEAVKELENMAGDILK